MNKKQKQRGVALLTVMMIVAVITIAAVAMSSEQTLLVRRVQNTLLLDTAWNYAKGAEHFAAYVLQQDLENTQFDADTEDEIWTNPLPPTPIDNAMIQGKISDLQGRFNLASLNNPDGTINPDAQGIFDRLLIALQASEEARRSIEDWMDADDQERANGAEDTYYQTLESPYLTANRPIASMEEFRLIKGIDQDLYEKLKQHLVIFPESDSKLNVNTASKEVLQAYFDIDQSKIDSLFNDIESDPMASVADLKAHPSLTEMVQKNEFPEDWVDVKSDYFALEVSVALGRVVTPLYSVLKRNQNGSYNVIYRLRGKG